MRQLDELHLNYPFAGNPMLRDLLKFNGVQIACGDPDGKDGYHVDLAPAQDQRAG